MTQRAGCRISKVRRKEDGREIGILRTPEPPEPNGATKSFVETLVFLLDHARKGTVLGYAFVFQIERDNGNVSTIQGADVANVEGADRLALLGAMRHMEADFMRRTYPDFNEGRPMLDGA